jgi:hypothetical protein
VAPTCKGWTWGHDHIVLFVQIMCGIIVIRFLDPNGKWAEIEWIVMAITLQDLPTIQHKKRPHNNLGCNIKNFMSNIF